MRQVRQAQQNLIARGLDFRHLPVQLGDPMTNVFRLGFLRLGLGDFLLAHERADLLGDTVAPRLQLLHFGQPLAPLLVERERLGDFRLVAGPARGETFVDEIGLFPDDFDVEHGRDYRNGLQLSKPAG